MPKPKNPTSPFRYFNSSPEIIRLVVMMYVSWFARSGHDASPTRARSLFNQVHLL
ncbi:hypothetical protein GCM10011393_34110 [Sphingopyxis bauzanensis]|jgi:hypothetical protein|nr:hypothetical protein GCM10011393_34110 [Sphingopyxis bauzanensis]